jgi:peptidyl-prolyl cis-trans isomerase SurA
MAKQNSGGPSAAQGGDLGVYKRGALAKVLEEQTFDLKPGQVTAPIRTRQGFVILKVTEHQDEGTPPLKQVEPQVQEAMYEQQMQPALRAYLTKLREDAYIEIKDGFVDSGASAKQTKPIYTAYAPPVSKKAKKIQQKRRFDRGGQYSTASKGVAQPVATPVAAVTTTSATASNAKSTSNAKPKKVKKVKIRFGQAPRNTLPAGPQEAGVGSDSGAGAASAAVTPGGVMAAGREAPGTAIAPVSSTSDTDPNYDPLAPKAAVQKKTRYSDRAKTEKEEKAKTKEVKAKEKVASSPSPATPEEIAAQKVQAAPLGLNGDTSKKKKKKVKVKGAPKERLQDKAPAPPAPPPVETPSKAPDRGTPLEGTPGEGRTPPTPDTTPAPATDTAPASTPTPPATSN